MEEEEVGNQYDSSVLPSDRVISFLDYFSIVDRMS